MKVCILFGVILAMLQSGHGQTMRKHDYNWLFGYGGGVPDSSRAYGGIIMSFNKGKINFIPQDRAFDFY